MSYSSRNVSGSRAISASAPVTSPPIQYGMPHAEYDVKWPRSKATISRSPRSRRRRAWDAAAIPAASPPMTISRCRHGSPSLSRAARAAGLPRERPRTTSARVCPVRAYSRAAAGPPRLPCRRSPASRSVTSAQVAVPFQRRAEPLDQLVEQLPGRPQLAVARSTPSPSSPSWAARQCAATSRWWSVRRAGRPGAMSAIAVPTSARTSAATSTASSTDGQTSPIRISTVGYLRRQPGVPVEHPLVEHHAAGDQLPDQPLVVLVRLQVRGRRHRRPALPLHRPPARVPGVLARGEGGVGGRPRAAPAARAGRG